MEDIRQLVATLKDKPEGLPQLMRLVCKTIVEQVGSTRASVWSFSKTRDSITCECLYDAWGDTYANGTVLKEEDFPAYFKAVIDDLKVVAPDAWNHPATSCFNEVYFKPLDIKSLLDFVVLVNNEPVGVLCCENCGELKQWTAADMDVLHRMSALIGLSWKMARQKH